VSRFLSTRQVADRCGVSRRTAARWVDAGILPATYTTGGHRRIREDDLQDFMDSRRSLLAMDRATPGLRVVVVGSRTETAGLFRALAAQLDPTVQVLHATPDLSGGLRLAENRPHLVVVDGGADPAVARSVVAAIRESTAASHAYIVAALHEQALVEGTHHILTTPILSEAVRDTLRSAQAHRENPTEELAG
jgi:excisionase family DNA binding protein